MVTVYANLHIFLVADNRLDGVVAELLEEELTTVEFSTRSPSDLNDIYRRKNETSLPHLIAGEHSQGWDGTQKMFVWFFQLLSR